MSGTVVILWLGTAAARMEHAADLDSWARSRFVVLREPTAAQPAPSPYNERVVEEVEALLADARTALDALDRESAASKLAEAEKLLLDHPDVPQSPWLMAEVWLLQAKYNAEANPTLSEELVERARAVSGERERTFATNEPLTVESKEGRSRARGLHVVGTRPDDSIFVDAVESGATTSVVPGKHHVRVLREGQPVFANWVTVPPNGAAAEITVSGSPPCTRQDLAIPRISGDRVFASPATRCPRWAVARPASTGIEVALCFKSRCGPLLDWQKGLGVVFDRTPRSHVEPEEWPAWLGWTLAGAALVVTGGIVAWQAGAFDGRERGPSRVEFIPPPR